MSEARHYGLDLERQDDFEVRLMDVPALLTLCELEIDQCEVSQRRSSGPKHHKRSLTFPHWWQLEQLCTSRSIGILESVTRQDDHLWIKSPQGEFTPRAVLAQWLAQHLTPEAVIGERSYTSPINGLLWMRDLGYSPLLISMIYRTLSELPFSSGGSIGQGVATLMGVIPPERQQSQLGIWGVLDIGDGSASWSLIELNSSSIEGRLVFKELASYGQNWVGEQALARALLTDHLDQNNQMWRDLSPKEREDWIAHVREQTEGFIQASWPHHLSYEARLESALDIANLSGSSLDIFKRFQYGTYLGVLAWIEHSLTQNRLGPEALRGIWVTGRQGVTLISKLRRILSSVNIKVAPPHAALRGAHRFIRSTLSPQGPFCYQVEEVSMHALMLYDHHEEITQTLLNEQDELPTVAEVMVGPTQGKLSLLLSAYGQPFTTIAEHPPLGEQRLLRVYYEGPHLFELEWVDTSSQFLSPQSSERQPQSGAVISLSNVSSDWSVK
jgi:hypothetical protein